MDILVKKVSTDIDNINCLPSCKVYKLVQDLAAAPRIVTMQGFNQPSLVPGPRKYPCRFPTARAFLRYQIPAVMPPIEVFLNMRDYHVPLGNEQPASGMKFQIPDK